MTEEARSVMLELDEVSLSYNSKKTSFDHGVHRVLDEVSLTLRQGETLGVIGRNGCGKTSILQLMAGIMAPTSGTVTRRKGTSAALLSLGLGFRPDLSGRDNAFLGAMLQGSNRRQAREFLEDIKEFSELGYSFEEPVKTYSSGMRSRLGFATALVTHVDILLIDEVLSVGDAQFRSKAESAMKQRIGGDQTVVFVSHMGTQMKSLCDRAIWIDDGKIKSEGETELVLDTYLKSATKGQKKL